MKKFAIFLLVLFVAYFAYATVTETHTVGVKSTSRAHYKNTAPNFSIMGKVSIVFEATDLDSTVTETFESIYGIVLRIVIDATGTDGAYDVLLRDESDVTIFTKTALDSDPAADFSYAVYEDDTEGNPWAGVPVGGTMDLVVTDAAALTGLTVHVYFLDFWK